MPPSLPISLSGINMANTADIHHVEGQSRIYVSHSSHPTPVYSSYEETIDGLPALPEKLYYALASSSLFFPRSHFGAERKPDRAFRAATASYKIDLLAAASHPLSSYNRQIGSHMSDLAQSFIDLYQMGKERWASVPYSEKGNAPTYLPWHLASVSHMPMFDLESLLPV